jgi:hypothetical protein
VFEKKTLLFSYAGGIFGYPLASYMSYPPEAYFTDFSCDGIVIIAANGHDVFLLNTWVMI